VPFKIRTQAALLSVVPLLAFIVLLGFALGLQRTTENTAYWSDHAREVLNAADAAVRELDDANNAVARYAKTRDERLLSRYSVASKAMVDDASVLQGLVRDNTAQSARAAHLRHLLGQARDVLNRYLDATKNHDRARAAAIESAPSTQRLGSDIIATKSAFDEAERKLAVQRFHLFGILLQGFSRAIVVVLLA